MIYNKDKNEQITRNFWSNEFACKDGTRRIEIDCSLVQELQDMRNFINKAYGEDHPIIITSGYRTESYNAKVGGIDGSEHTKGRAADIQIPGMTPEEVFYLARHFDFNCIILYDTFVHVDIGAYHGRLDKREDNKGRALQIYVV